MKSGIFLQPAFVLHRRSYRETSFLVELFTKEHGRLTVLAKGIRKSHLAATGLLQPFTPLTVSWTGKAELKTITHIELRKSFKPLYGESLFAGFYLNELLTGLLQKWDAHPTLYNHYEETIDALNEQNIEKILRAFEKNLLEELGYGLLPKSSAALKKTFLPYQSYRFIPEHGFVSCPSSDLQMNAYIFCGENLIAIAEENWEKEGVLQDAKRLMRIVLTPLLGAKSINSRKLFCKPSEMDIA